MYGKTELADSTVCGNPDYTNASDFTGNLRRVPTIIHCGSPANLTR